MNPTHSAMYISVIFLNHIRATYV